MNKQLNKFYLFCKCWKGKIRSRLNDIFVVSISFLYFLIECPFWFSCFNFQSILYLFNDLLFRLNDIINRLKRYCFVFFSSFFLVLISFPINIGKEMSLPGFRRCPPFNAQFRSRMKQKVKSLQINCQIYNE